MSQPSVFWWQRYGTLAQMAQATVALLGFVAILLQINEIRTNNRATSARQAFLGYTDLAFKNPKFAQPDYDEDQGRQPRRAGSVRELRLLLPLRLRGRRSVRSPESANGRRPAITT